MKIKELHTDNFTIKAGHLDVGNGHKVYFEQWGNPDATPILTFHGGPGSSYKARHKVDFDPEKHQIIFYDQRGCGNSLPYGKLQHNTTDDLVADAKKILDHLGVSHVYAFGTSWGSTLATLFTIKYPEAVKATIIGAVFTGTKAEIDHICRGHFERFYPEVWEKFVASAPAKFQGDPASYHYHQLLHGDDKAAKTSSKALENLERPLLTFDWAGYPNEAIKPDGVEKTEYDHVPYQIYGHYLSQGCFLPEGYILEQAKTVNTPFAIVQGRYDMACPPQTAYRLHQAMPHSKLYITREGHSTRTSENRTVVNALIDTMFV